MAVKRDLAQIGMPLPRADAYAKVTGQERYAVDYYGRDLVWAGVKRAGIPHARLKRIVVESARELPGVLAVLTHQDVPGSNRLGLIRKDRPVLVDTRIRYGGDAVALILAEDRPTLRRALDLIRLEAEPLPTLFDPEEALKEGAPRIHEDHPDGNLLQHLSLGVGEVEEAFSACAAVVEGRFEVPLQEHAYLETEAGWACIAEDGRLVLIASTQSPFRGFGGPQVLAAMEQMMDLLAARLGMDPLEIRRQNAVRRGDRNGIGVTLVHSTGMGDCLEVLAAHPLWREREGWKAAAAPFKRRGVGLACVVHGSGYGPFIPDEAQAKVELTDEGRLRIFCGVSDMGQGNASTCLQIAGEILNQEAHAMELVLPDTDRCLPSGPASASRCTYTYGNALIGAAGAMKRRLLDRAAALLRVADRDDLSLLPGRARHRPSGKEISLSRLARSLDPAERVCTHSYRVPAAQERPHLQSSSDTPGLPHLLFSYAAHLACVEVDELTGEVEVRAYLAVSDCGRVINPQIYQQQVQGGIAQGLGYALSEEFMVEKGRVRTPNLATYILPTALDVPEMVSLPVEIPEPTGPFGLKGIGEISINGPLPAVANAVADACGVRIFRAPLTAERVLKALEESGRREARP